MVIAIILALLNFIYISSCVIEPESGLIFAVGNGSAPPGSGTIPVNVAMYNSDPVKGLQTTICDEGNYLTCTGCESAARVSGFSCISNELANSCATVILVSMDGDLIDVGDGPLFSINYDVADDAPSAQCVNLIPVEIKVSDENNNFLDATVELGEFCID